MQSTTTLSNRVGLLSLAVTAAATLVWSGCGPSNIQDNDNETDNNNNVSLCDPPMTNCGACNQPCDAGWICDNS